ncbi:hypothetical protein, partial [Kitasatospora sp. NPDC085879]|uniref:hypothetical protein n=1 Tax=Kitasatospora sp. NPDC085879 TaxID=3154769 RepID=UPI003438ACAE
RGGGAGGPARRPAAPLVRAVPTERLTAVEDPARHRLLHRFATWHADRYATAHPPSSSCAGAWTTAPCPDSLCHPV